MIRANFHSCDPAGLKHARHLSFIAVRRACKASDSSMQPAMTACSLQYTVRCFLNIIAPAFRRNCYSQMFFCFLGPGLASSCIDFSAEYHPNLFLEIDISGGYVRVVYRNQLGVGLQPSYVRCFDVVDASS